jgi:hypothetical protein
MTARMYPKFRNPAALALILGLCALAILLSRRVHYAGNDIRRLDAFTAAGRPMSPPVSDAASNEPARELQESRLKSTNTALASAQPVADETRAMPLPELGNSGDEASRMVIRTGWASIEVSSVDSVTPLVRLLADQIGGYVANSSIEGGHEQARTARFEIKAPAQNFQRLVDGLSPLGKIESVNVTAEDVGEEYVDVNARMANNHRLEDRLIQLLATRTGKLKDVLDVERELARVREEIERQEGRLRYLRSRTALSTLNIAIHEPVPITSRPGPNPITAAARRAWRNFVDLLAATIASLGVLVPVGLVATLAWRIFGPKRPMAATPAGTPAR